MNKLRVYPSAFSQGSAGRLKVEFMQPPLFPPPRPILGAKEPHEYIYKKKQQWNRIKFE